MKKILIFLVVASMIISPNLAFAKTYLLTDENYYSSGSVTKGFLDEKITATNVGVDIFNSLKDSANRNLVIFSEGMTFNEYYLKNNISPEDNFYRKRDRAEQIVELRPGVFLNSLPTADYPVTYV